MHDDRMRAAVAECPGVAVAWWMMATWSYEEASSPIISDAAYDWLASYIDANWDAIDHWHKPLLRRDALKGRLGMTGKWPLRTMSAAVELM